MEVSIEIRLASSSYIARVSLISSLIVGTDGVLPSVDVAVRSGLVVITSPLLSLQHIYAHNPKKCNTKNLAQSLSFSTQLTKQTTFVTHKTSKETMSNVDAVSPVMDCLAECKQKGWTE